MRFREYNTSTIHIDSILQLEGQHHHAPGTSGGVPSPPASAAAAAAAAGAVVDDGNGDAPISSNKEIISSSSSSHSMILSSSNENPPSVQRNNHNENNGNLSTNTSKAIIHQEYHLIVDHHHRHHQEQQHDRKHKDHTSDDNVDDNDDCFMTWSMVTPTHHHDRHNHQSHHSGKKENSAGSLLPRKLRNVVKSIQQICKDLFLPVGYPHTVAPGYLEYQFYDSLQGLCSYLRGVVSTSAVLAAAGVGDAQATAMSAAMTWAIRDGLGMIGGLLFSYMASPHFDAHVKEFRLLADVLNDIALTIDMALPSLLSCSFFSNFSRWYHSIIITADSTASFYHHFLPNISLPMPSAYLVLTSISTLCKVACGISAGATKGNITDHFAICGNRADVNAKESTQETLVSLLGMIVGVGLARWLHGLEVDIDGVMGVCEGGIGDQTTCSNNVNPPSSSMMSMITNVQTISWVIFMVLTIVHVWANYVGVQRLRLRTLNRERAKVALHPLIEGCGKWVLKVCGNEISDGNDLDGGDPKKTSFSKDRIAPECLQNLCSPVEVSESLWTSIRGMFNPGNIHLGIRLQDLVRFTSSGTASPGSSFKWAKQHWEFLFHEFRHEKYLIVINGTCNNINILMRIGANSQDELKAFLHAHVIDWVMSHSTADDTSWARRKQVLSRTHEITEEFFAEVQCKSDQYDLHETLAQNGWDLTRLYLGFTQWRCDWE